MASSSWVFGNYEMFEHYYPKNRNNRVHPITDIFAYKDGIDSRLILVHKIVKDDPLKSIVGRTIQHIFGINDFVKKYGHDENVVRIRMKDIKFDFKNKKIRIKPHKWLFFLKPLMVLQIDRIWSHTMSEMPTNSLLVEPLFDTTTNRICWIMPTYWG